MVFVKNYDKFWFSLTLFASFITVTVKNRIFVYDWSELNVAGVKGNELSATDPNNAYTLSFQLT